MTPAARFAGYAAIFDRPDKGGDIVRKGAFADARAGLPLFWRHDVMHRIGTIEQICEDDTGLRVVASVAGVDVAVGQGLSFGYRVREASKGTFRELKRLDLIEVSLVAQPMQPLARVIAVQTLDTKSTQGETAWTMK